MRTKKVFSGVILVAILICGSSSITGAEEKKPAQPEKKKNHFSVSFGVMNLNTNGNDVRVGDVYRYREAVKLNGNGSDPASFTYTYGAKFEPLVTPMKKRLTLVWEVAYGNDRRSWVVRSWGLDTDGSLTGRVSSPAPNYADREVNAVRMWEHTLYPLFNNASASNLSPVSYWASNNMRVRRFDLFYGKQVSNNFNVFWGGSTASLHNNRNEGLGMTSFIANAYYPNHQYNKVTIESFSQTDYNRLWGPLSGLKGNMKYKRLAAELELSQSVLMGKVLQSGNWIDIDDLQVVSGSIRVDGTLTTIRKLGYYRGEFPFRFNEQMAVFNTELRPQWKYRVTKNATLRGMAMVSYWNGVNIAPAWSMPGEWTAGSGSGWKSNKTDLVFKGCSLSVEVRF